MTWKELPARLVATGELTPASAKMAERWVDAVEEGELLRQHLASCPECTGESLCAEGRARAEVWKKKASLRTGTYYQCYVKGCGFEGTEKEVGTHIANVHKPKPDAGGGPDSSEGGP